MKITKTHIDQLYTFTEKHYVEWYDLQTELVDHLANDIEQIGKENPKLSFEDARDNSFKKFGIMGFSSVVEKRQKALNKKYWLLILKEFKLFFSLPKILLTAFLIVSYFSILNFLENKNILISASLTVLVLIQFLFIYKTFKKIRKKQKATNKKWLFENIMATFGGFGFFVSIPFQIYQTISYSLPNNYWLLWALSIFVISYSIVLYIAIKIIPKKMTEYMVKNYSEYQPIL